MHEEWNAPITSIKGIGEQKARLFDKLNIRTIEELIHYYPRDYREYPELITIDAIHEGESVAVHVHVCDNFFQKKIRGKVITTVSATDDTGKIGLVFFNLTYLRQVLKPNAEFVMFGVARIKGNHYELAQPQMFHPSEYEENRMRLQPVYGTTAGLSSKTISKCIQQVLINGCVEEDSLEESFRAQYNLVSESEAIKGIHFPEDRNRMLTARRRLVFEEFYRFFITLHQMRESNYAVKSNFPFIETSECRRLTEALPYALTNAQKRVYREIADDLQSSFVMNRLVQGDVGSGKTILAILAMLMCVTNGYQTAFMAPTEVLAVQHYQLMMRLTKTYDLLFRCILLTGKMTIKEKREAYESIAAGTVNAIIGTHALFQERVEYRNLALVVTDEQHRFGVKQREAFMNKGAEPHVLIMSATPIPRTLATVLYADLQVSVVDELPRLRKPIKNCVVDVSYRPTAYTFIQKEIQQGHQAYVICPQVADDEDSMLENVTDYAGKLRMTLPDTIRINTLHGQMKSAEKARIMDSFAKGDIDILVSTTVIEVGIDVPNATVIMIENAERFGLAQLHQLRGRVGRGDAQSYCILIASDNKEHSKERLQILLKSNDGFYIANEDLRLRGPGDLLGVRQSGEMLFRIGDIYNDSELLMLASEAAQNT